MTEIKRALCHSPVALAQDFAGALALVVCLVVLLHLPGLF